MATYRTQCTHWQPFSDSVTHIYCHNRLSMTALILNMIGLSVLPVQCVTCGTFAPTTATGESAEDPPQDLQR